MFREIIRQLLLKSPHDRIVANHDETAGRLVSQAYDIFPDNPEGARALIGEAARIQRAGHEMANKLYPQS